MNKKFKRAAALAMAVVLGVFALTGCSGKKAEKELEKAAAAKAEAEAKPMITLGDQSISAGAFNFMLRYNMSGDFISTIYRSMYGQDVDVWSYDMYGNGQIYGDTLKEEVLHNVKHLMLEQAHMADYGVELTEEEKTAISAAAKEFIDANDPEVLDKMSATQENVETMLTLRTIQSKMEKAMSADVDPVVSDEEAAQRDVSYVSFTAETEAAEEEETEDLAETEADEEAAEAIAEAAESAASEAEALAEPETETRTKAADETEESPAEEAAAEEETEEETEDPAKAAAREKALAKAEAFLESMRGTNQEGFENAAEEAAEADHVDSGEFTFGADSTYPNAAIISATEGLEDETLVDHVVQVDDVYYVLFVTDAFNEEATEARKEEIVEERKAARVEEILEGWEGGSEDTEGSTEAEGQKSASENGAQFTVDEEAFAALTYDYLLYQEEQTEEDLEEFMTEEMSEDLTEDMQDATETVQEG